jgi:putative membrane protein
LDRDAEQTGKIEQASAGIAHSARVVETSAREISRTIDRRDQLAANRTMLASERTYAAWIRTSLAALVTGVGSRALLEQVVPEWLASLTASVLVLFAAFCLLAAIWPGLDDQVPPRGPDASRIPYRVLVVATSVLMLLTLAVLIGIWAA